MRSALILSIATTLAITAGALPSRADLEAGDRAWSARAEVLVDERLARPDRIEEAIGAYRETIESNPASLEARWKLLRALHYAIDFSSLDEREKEARVVEAVTLARASTEGIAAGSEGDRAQLLFWSAIAWGTRAQRVGLLTLVREGAAGRMHDHAVESLKIDPRVDRGGALRLLSRLHATVPRVPFVSGWVDRDEALPLAERAMALDQGHPGNPLILALTLLEFDPDRKEEARRLLVEVASSSPRAEFAVEDLAIREQARERLEALNADG